MRVVTVLLFFVLSQINCELSSIAPPKETTDKDAVDSNLTSNVTEINTNDVSVRENPQESKDNSVIVDRNKEHEKVFESIINSHFPKQHETVASSNVVSTPVVLPQTVTVAKDANIVNNNVSTQHPLVVHDSIGTKILLYTQSNPVTAEVLVPGDPSTINKISSFRSEKPLRVIIHGSFDGLDNGHWMTDMKDKFLQRDDENVILCDWSKGASANLPDQRMTNIRMLGSKVADVLKDFIKLKNVKPEDIHVIAHSLGTFAADVIGRQIQNLGRISALDPGGPNFDVLPIDMRLDSSDALFVDAIHTDVENTSLSLYGRGTAVAVGHMDFFPNGGSNQPGCNVQRFEDLIIRPIGEGVRRFVACHHYRAIDYFMETILPTSSNCLMLAYKCDNYTNYLDGKCASCDKSGIDCAEMGFKSIDYFKDDDKMPKKFYITTNRRKPYCRKLSINTNFK
ncbi:pancreatic triacylglycerol lipase-like protein [Leptotrombidium deliense]|uniref:Pancreatic triacylglycerol lipase-like protein n=1 Tax=Leptotrombidium deliense TaxID=299467 RepID=A0A443SNP0_9ACAR|nr:pancreatic triacylglycerol lipase-like protein [Leptotrombidium deliense]